MKQSIASLLIVALTNACATSGGISYKSDEHGLWHWADHTRNYYIAWAVKPDDTTNFLPIFKQRAARLCDGNVLSSKYEGIRERSGSRMMSAGNNVFTTTRVDSKYAFGRVYCADIATHQDSYRRSVENYSKRASADQDPIPKITVD